MRGPGKGFLNSPANVTCQDLTPFSGILDGTVIRENFSKNPLISRWFCLNSYQTEIASKIRLYNAASGKRRIAQMTVKEIERQVKKLPRKGLTAFREWFRRFDADAWDRQIENDVRSGKLTRFAKEALSSYKSGKAKEI